MSVMIWTGLLIYGGALVCGILSAWRRKMCWAACVLAILSSALLLYEGAKGEQLSAGLLILALIMLLGWEREGQA